MRVLMIAAFAALLAAPVAAQGFTAENGLRVTPVQGGFSVEGGASGGARAIWCAAGDYAVRKAGARGGDRLYLAMPRKAGLGQRAAVGFSLDAGGLTPSAVLVTGLSLGNAGQMSVSAMRAVSARTKARHPAAQDKQDAVNLCPLPAGSIAQAGEQT